MTLQAAVFLDRDGVLVPDMEWLTEPNQVTLYPDVPAAVKVLNDLGLVLVVVTNQPVVARGLATEADVHRVHERIAQLVEDGGGRLERFYFCPHHPSATLLEYRRDCSCRKPEPGMLLQAAHDLGLDLAKSYMIGDRVTDIAAGVRAHCQTILLKTGKHLAPPIESKSAPARWPDPDWSFHSLQEAAIHLGQACPNRV